MATPGPGERSWLVWIPGPEAIDLAVKATGPDAWVKGGHLFVGVEQTQAWTMAWAPGGWLSIQLMEGARAGGEGRPRRIG